MRNARPETDYACVQSAPTSLLPGPTKEQRANTTHAIGDFVERIDVGHHAICTAG